MYKFTLPHTPHGRKMTSRHSALRTEYWKWTVCLISLDRILPVKFEKWVNQLQDLICMILSSPNQQWWIWLTYICRTLQILTKLVVSVLWLSDELDLDFQFHLYAETYSCQVSSCTVSSSVFCCEALLFADSSSSALSTVSVEDERSHHLHLISHQSVGLVVHQ